jgi:hypothetical protein
VDKLTRFFESIVKSAGTDQQASQLLNATHRSLLEAMERAPALCSALVTRPLFTTALTDHLRGPKTLRGGTGAIVARSLVRMLQLLAAAHATPAVWAAQHEVSDLCQRLMDAEADHGVLVQRAAARLSSDLQALVPTPTPVPAPAPVPESVTVTESSSSSSS